MSKELLPLEAFERLKNKSTLSTDWSKQKTAYDYNKLEYDTIETALKKQEQESKKYEQLKDIEAELGVDILTLISAVKQQKIWVKYENKIDCCDECEYVLLDDFIYFYWNNGEHKVCGIKDYGKTWALTKEELNK